MSGIVAVFYDDQKQEQNPMRLSLLESNKTSSSQYISTTPSGTQSVIIETVSSQSLIECCASNKDLGVVQNKIR